MGNNSFGSLFQITTWGESHGPAIGVVIDGCPAGVNLSVEDLVPDLQKRAPGRSPLTSPRFEDDLPEILSGVFQGKTTGAPISVLIRNKNYNSSTYTNLAKIMRPGHAGFTYLAKYGIFDPHGGGRSSGRETACRVVAGSVAKKMLERVGISCFAYLVQLGSICAGNLGELHQTYDSPVYCPDPLASKQMVELLLKVKEEGDSIGGVIGFEARGLPIGLGDPVYEKLEANLAKAMLSIPASKGFEIGCGFRAAEMQGSQHNDLFVSKGPSIKPSSNHAGGVLGGISTALPLYGRVVFKPTSTIRKPQETVTVEGERALMELPADAKHDPCVAIRAVPVVEAMLALTLVNAWLQLRLSRL